MVVQTQYRFASEKMAYRFLNTASHFNAEQLIVKYGRNNRHVLVKYQYAEGTFDSTASELDDLARELEGEEVR
ncbi:hypothetical protein CA267_017670 [Alteromonas pelagimontana]|uniref:Uncharacterized protein n=1 Tax=Alteromonas pelagimontana TaxID=1858656 RepID=A0A6M4MGX0_9ALTE|nr:hypothetical protein [Alteromonas pelagimontana]QJR82451.1 hypothetical protein CA267_017670 [Alteromonas pelagimontana]